MITTRDLMDRYNIKTRQGIIQFVKKHLDEINHDGEEHATMQKGEWAFDTEAVRILDQLRGHFGHVQSLLMDRATLDAHEAVRQDGHAPPVALHDGVRVGDGCRREGAQPGRGEAGV